MRLAVLLLVAALAVLPAPPTAAQSLETLYQVTLVRAAPGHLLDLIAHYQAAGPRHAEWGDAAPFLMRHSQGDHWDLMLLYPMERYAAYHHPDRHAQRAAHAEEIAASEARLADLAAWREDLFAYGPDLATVRDRFDGAGFFHVEMFKALPGKLGELIEQREMENRYYAGLGHPGNLVFVRDAGAPTDVFTLGFYRDIKHFAENSDFSIEDEDRAAKAAGFESVYAISPYLRSLIAWHHDTLAVAVR